MNDGVRHRYLSIPLGRQCDRRDQPPRLVSRSYDERVVEGEEKGRGQSSLIPGGK